MRILYFSPVLPNKGFPNENFNVFHENATKANKKALPTRFLPKSA